MTAKIDISPEQLAIVQRILKDHLPLGTLAWAFGSRVTWTAKPFSDLDIALEGAAPLSPDVLIDLEEAFDSSDLPWKVDVIDLNAVSPEFRTIVERQRVPADWKDVTLSDVSDPSRKITYGIVQPGQLHSEGVPIVRVNNFRGNSLDLTDRLAVSPEIEEKYRRSRPRPGDLLISLVGSIGQLSIAPPEIEGWNLARAVGLVPFANQAVANWSFYSLQSTASQDFMNQRANTTVQTTFNLKDLAKIPIQLPPEWEMAGILTTLQALDDKIELNRRMNEPLEAMARAVFRDWFVDFGPTRRKAAGLTDPAAILGGLLPDPTQAAPLAALFPDSFGANGLPEGWKEREVGDLSPVVGGGTPSTKESAFWDGGTHNWATPKDLSKLSGLFLRETERQVTDAGLAKVSSGLSPVGSVLLSSRAPIGYVAIAEKPVAVNQGFIVMQPTPAFPTEFAYFWTLENLDLIKANANGSTFQEISKKNFRPLRVNHAGEDLVAKFAEVAGPMMDLIRNNEQENQTLADTRDLLLPKLMSGELRLTGAEGVV
ncbi:restriction endonuclease subunit S [Sulfitobacter sp. AS59]|uniref:restriction endonuclease subunit S n=1 Tax=Sulfitobacter sp. AS59 TaxID=3135784 RepID=UPI00317D263B